MNEGVRMRFGEMVPLEIEGVAYLRLELVQWGLAEVLFENGQPETEDEYTQLVETAEQVLTTHGYVVPVELAPPVVAWTESGRYMRQIEPLTEAELLEAQRSLHGSTTDENRPIERFVRSRLVAKVVHLRYGKRTAPDEAIRDGMLVQLDGMMGEQGWVLKEERLYERPLAAVVEPDVAQERLQSWIRSQQGETIRTHDLHKQAMFILYDRRFYRFDRDDVVYAPCMEAVRSALWTCGYQVKTSDAYYWPQPLTLPDDAAERVAMAFDVAETIETQIGAVYSVETLLNSLMMALGCDPTNREQITRHLLREPVVQAEFERRGVEQKIVTIRGEQLIPPQPNNIRAFKPTIRRVNEPGYQVRLDKEGALPVFGVVVVTDEKTNNLVMLRIIGTPQAVKANWAQLVGHNRHAYIDETFVRLNGMKQHLIIKARLPMGLDDWVLLHRQASLREMNGAEPFFVLAETQVGIPDTFFPMLDKALPLPMKPEWVEYLWTAGREQKLIVPSAAQSRGWMAWRVLPNKGAWQEIVAEGVVSRACLVAEDSGESVVSEEVKISEEVEEVEEVKKWGSEEKTRSARPLRNHYPLTTNHFPLGQIVFTLGTQRLAEAGVNLNRLLERHRQGDWGEMEAEDMRANDRALKDGTRLFSSYEIENGKVWIITEHDRSRTTLLLPSEY